MAVTPRYVRRARALFAFLASAATLGAVAPVALAVGPAGGEVLMKFEPGTSAKQRAAIVSRQRGRIVDGVPALGIYVSV